MKWTLPFIVLLLTATAGFAATLEDLKKLEITCFVPGWLPEGLRLTNVDMHDDAAGPDADAGRHFMVYALEYNDGHGRTFSIDSAYEGVGDRNIMEEEDTEEMMFPSSLGRIFIIYRPPGKEGPKAAIQSNWVRDEQMQAELKKDSRPGLGRFHGFSANGLTLAEFQRVISSLRPVRDDKPKPQSSPSTSKIHPKVFNMIDCWISDSEVPVVTEINLDAVSKNDNQFQEGEVKQEGEWLRCPTPEANGFMRYRVLEQKGDRYRVEYQENWGGSLTSASVIEFVIDKREVKRDGKAERLRVLRVLAYEHKP